MNKAYLLKEDSVMAFIRFVLWTACSVGIGIFLATVELGGKTPLQHFAKAYSEKQPELSKAKSNATDLFEDVKHQVVAPLKTGAPLEKHTPSEKDAVNQIIARRQTASKP